MQGARDPGAIEGEADALDAAVGAQPQDDDRAHAAGFLRHVGQRIVFRHAESRHLIAGDFHVVSSRDRDPKPAARPEWPFTLSRNFGPKSAAAHRERKMDFEYSDRTKALRREAQQVHGRGHLSGRARLRGADGEGEGPLAAPADHRAVQGRGEEARPMEHVPPCGSRDRRHARHDGPVQPRIRADLRGAGPFFDRFRNRSTARHPTPATWKYSPATAARSSRTSG